MAKYISTAITQKYPPLTSGSAGDSKNVKHVVAVDTSLALGDLILFCKLPAGHEPVDGNIFATDLDTNGTPLITMTVGILNDAGTDLVSGTEFVVDSAVGKAGTLERFGLRAGLNLAAIDGVNTASDVGTQNAYAKKGDRVLAAKITAAAATKAAGSVGVSFTYKTP